MVCSAVLIADTVPEVDIDELDSESAGRLMVPVAVMVRETEATPGVRPRSDKLHAKRSK